MEFEPGQKLRLKRRWPSAEEYPDALAPVPAGASGVVRELVPADVKGAHDDEEDAVVVEFPDHGNRAVAFGLFDAEEVLEVVE